MARTIVEQRTRLVRLLKENPGLKPRRAARFEEAYEDAGELASAETGLPLETFPEQAPYDLDQVIDRHFYPDSTA